ncbi:tol-pal system-associated acyl-CoA thioesterase [Rudaea sp.]|uniref:tol-pal system-associated acyl-CoA thioesterase n=1 Tax=Rudaea sp. TaxID=2136325 RepID=UPI002ECFDB23
MNSDAATAAPVFSWPVRIYWEDTDAGGVVYYANYLRFLERARTEWLRSLGIDQSQVRDVHGVVFVVREVAIEYSAPAKLDDELESRIDAVERRSASMTFAQRILRRSDGAVLVTARVRVACVAADGFKPQRIPESLFSR